MRAHSNSEGGRARPCARIFQPAHTLFLAGLAFPTMAMAALLPINNPSFENPVTAPGIFAGGQTSGPAGWTVYNRGATNNLRFFGVWNPATTPSFTDPVPDGANVGVVFLDNTTGIAEAGLQQVLAATLQPSTRYTLTVDVGNFAPSAGAPWNFTGFPGYRVDLLAGSTVIASDNNTLQPAEGRFLTSTVAITIERSHVNAGQALGIRLVSLNGPGVEVNFDRVRLDAVAVTEPPTAIDNPSRLSNLSILTDLAAPGENFTLGFVVGGSGTGAVGLKPVVIRAAGPSLVAFGIAGPLDDPSLELFSGSTKAGENDNWSGSPALASRMAAVGAFAYSGPSSRDAALTADARVGGNSVIVRAGAASTNGIGAVLAEIYDATSAGGFTATTPRLINVSVLKRIGSGLTAGFVIAGGAQKTVLVRAVGPGLAGFGIASPLADPRIELFDGTSRRIGANDNWGDTPALGAIFAAVGAFALDVNSKDAALVATLPPGSYSVQVSGVGGAGSQVLVEVYEAP